MGEILSSFYFNIQYFILTTIKRGYSAVRCVIQLGIFTSQFLFFRGTIIFSFSLRHEPQSWIRLEGPLFSGIWYWTVVSFLYSQQFSYNPSLYTSSRTIQPILFTTWSRYLPPKATNSTGLVHPTKKSFLNKQGQYFTYAFQ